MLINGTSAQITAHLKKMGFRNLAEEQDALEAARRKESHRIAGLSADAYKQEYPQGLIALTLVGEQTLQCRLL